MLVMGDVEMNIVGIVVSAYRFFGVDHLSHFNPRIYLLTSSVFHNYPKAEYLLYCLFLWIETEYNKLVYTTQPIYFSNSKCLNLCLLFGFDIELLQGFHYSSD